MSEGSVALIRVAIADGRYGAVADILEPTASGSERPQGDFARYVSFPLSGHSSSMPGVHPKTSAEC